MDMNRQEWKEKAAEMSGVPKDVAMGLPILTITGTDELCVENYRGITEYTDQIIRLQTRCGQIKIGGRKLEVIYYTNDEMMIHGHIRTIEYQTIGGSAVFEQFIWYLKGYVRIRVSGYSPERFSERLPL